MEKYQKYFTLAILVLSFFTFLRSCGTASDLKGISKEIETVKNKINKIDSATIKSNDMVKIIKETPNWKTLEIEELSDKNKVPVNYYKNMDK
jgi:hypothetical protein